MFRPNLALRAILVPAERVEKPRKNDHRATASIRALSSINSAEVTTAGVYYAQEPRFTGRWEFAVIDTPKLPQ